MIYVCKAIREVVKTLIAVLGLVLLVRLAITYCLKPLWKLTAFIFRMLWKVSVWVYKKLRVRYEAWRKEASRKGASAEESSGIEPVVTFPTVVERHTAG